MSPIIYPAVLVSYLIGAFPTGHVLASLQGVNIRAKGSGGTGATNVLRSLGWKWGLLTLAIDIGKGLAATWLGRWADDGSGWATGACVLAAVAGHSWPVYIGFRGGKSVATFAGPVAALYPGYTVIAAGLFFSVLALTRYVSLGSILSTALLVGLILASPGPVPVKLGFLGSGLIIVWRHKENVKRLLAGTENRFSSSAQNQGR